MKLTIEIETIQPAKVLQIMKLLAGTSTAPPKVVKKSAVKKKPKGRKKCKRKGCKASVRAKGLCSAHYQKMRATAKKIRKAKKAKAKKG